jgi:hypothetical protein
MKVNAKNVVETKVRSLFCCKNINGIHLTPSFAFLLQKTVSGSIDHIAINGTVLRIKIGECPLIWMKGPFPAGEKVSEMEGSIRGYANWRKKKAVIADGGYINLD